MNRNAICASVALTFFLIGLSGISMAVYVSVYGYEDLSHSAAIRTTEHLVSFMHDYN